MRMLCRTVVSLIFVVAVTVLPGCGKDDKASQQGEKFAETMQEKATENRIDIDTDKEGITVMSEDGSGEMKIGAHASIPANWPKDIPIYQNAQVMMTNTRGNEGFQLMLQSSDSVEKATSFYRQQMTSGGWKEEQFMSMGSDMNNLFYSKGDRTTAVMVGAEESQTFINITATN